MEMAVSLNGGSWHKHYTYFQKVSWCQKYAWSLKRFKSDVYYEMLRKNGFDSEGNKL